MSPANCFALLLISALAFSDSADGKARVASPVALTVDSAPAVAVPIDFSSAGAYRGPYDPADPKGLAAAQHRAAKLAADSALRTARSYVPPGVGAFVKKESVKVAVKEGERFALRHPAETSDLIGIATKAKHLYHLGSSKLKKAAKA